jgi:hypothetical protein
MTFQRIACLVILGGGLCVSGRAASDYTTAPAISAEVEALYTAAIERRAGDILEALALTDTAKASEVRSVIVNHYRALRARDSVIDAYLRAKGEDSGEDSPERQQLFERITPPLHQLYIQTLSAYLTPAEVEIVKDKMTYNKVKVTFDAYCEIIPKLTESEKAMIMETLKVAREEAIDGGSSSEKHAIFDRHKEQINARLKAGGHDVDKAFQDWEAKQGLASGAKNVPQPSSN